MNINAVIKNEMEKSDGKVQIVKVPKEKKGTVDDLYKLEQEIKSQVDANAAMSERAWKNANKSKNN